MLASIPRKCCGARGSGSRFGAVRRFYILNYLYPTLVAKDPFKEVWQQLLSLARA